MLMSKIRKLTGDDPTAVGDDPDSEAPAGSNDVVDRATANTGAQDGSPEAQMSAVATREGNDQPADEAPVASQGRKWARITVFGVLPALVLLAALGAGYLKWHVGIAREALLARTQSVQAATDGTIAMLSYRADTVEAQLHAARERLTGKFRDSYTSLTNDVVIPGAKQKGISVQAKVPAAAPMSTTANHAIVLVFVNQTTTVGADAPTDTASSVRVTLDKVGARWLISDFTPV